MIQLPLHESDPRNQPKMTEFWTPVGRWGDHFLQADFHDRSLSRGQKLSRRASEERGCEKFLWILRRVWASRPWFLFHIEPDFHLLSQTSEWLEQKIEFVLSCQS